MPDPEPVDVPTRIPPIPKNFMMPHDPLEQYQLILRATEIVKENPGSVTAPEKVLPQLESALRHFDSIISGLIHAALIVKQSEVHTDADR